MARLKNMGLFKSLSLLLAAGILAALLCLALVFLACEGIRAGFPSGGIAFEADGSVMALEQPTQQQQQILVMLDLIQLFSCVLLPICGMFLAGFLFYRWKLKEPISILRSGAERIQNQDLDFSIAVPSHDELGELCAAFETMRAELLKTNQALWRQAEERKRLNAAFAHDLRNPITVLKGTVKLLRQGKQDERTLDRLECYTSRIEQYVEAMSQIQRLEQMPLRPGAVACTDLRDELEETARLLAPGLSRRLSASCSGSVVLDHGLFLTVAENLIDNAARYAKSSIAILLEVSGGILTLSVSDDGPGYPPELLQDGPKPFGRACGDSDHFGMGLYSCHILCGKHGGGLQRSNHLGQHGALAAATFQISEKP